MHSTLIQMYRPNLHVTAEITKAQKKVHKLIPSDWCHSSNAVLSRKPCNQFTTRKSLYDFEMLNRASVRQEYSPTYFVEFCLIRRAQLNVSLTPAGDRSIMIGFVLGLAMIIIFVSGVTRRGRGEDRPGWHHPGGETQRKKLWANLQRITDKTRSDR